MPTKAQLLRQAMDRRVPAPVLTAAQPDPGTGVPTEESMMRKLQALTRALGTPALSTPALGPPAPDPPALVRQEPSIEGPSKRAQIIEIISKALIAMGESGMPQHQLQQRRGMAAQIAATKGQQVLARERGAEQRRQFEAGHALDLRRLQESIKRNAFLEKLSTDRLGISLKDLGLREKSAFYDNLLAEMDVALRAETDPLQVERLQGLIEDVGARRKLERGRLRLQEQGLWAPTVTTKKGPFGPETSVSRRLTPEQWTEFQQRQGGAEPFTGEVNPDDPQFAQQTAQLDELAKNPGNQARIASIIRNSTTLNEAEREWLRQRYGVE